MFVFFCHFLFSTLPQLPIKHYNFAIITGRSSAQRLKHGLESMSWDALDSTLIPISGTDSPPFAHASEYRDNGRRSMTAMLGMSVHGPVSSEELNPSKSLWLCGGEAIN